MINAEERDIEPRDYEYDPKPPKQRPCLRLDDVTYAALKRMRNESGMPMCRIVKNLLEWYASLPGDQQKDVTR